MVFAHGSDSGCNEFAAPGLRRSSIAILLIDLILSERLFEEQGAREAVVEHPRGWVPSRLAKVRA